LQGSLITLPTPRIPNCPQ